MMNLIVLPFIGLLIFLALVLFAVWIWAIIDCLRSDSSGEYKLLWLLIIVLLNVFGAALYFLLSNRMQDKNMSFQGKKGKYLTRSSDNEMIGGVCGGIAEHYSFDPAIVRILWVVFTIFVNGVGILLYIIAWIAIPSDKDVKNVAKTKTKSQKSESLKKDTSIKAEKEAKSPKRKRKTFLNILWVIVVFSLLISFIAGFMILFAGFKYGDFEQVSVKSLVVDVRSDISEKVVIDEILNSHNYKNLQGSDLELIEIREPLDGSCTLYERDPYGLRIYDSGCREFVHKFFVESDSLMGYRVNTLVSGGKVLKMTFTSFNSIDNVSMQVNECPLQRESDLCITLYDPVCGFEDLPVEGALGETFSNDCFACLNPEINYWIEGECPY